MMIRKFVIVGAVSLTAAFAAIAAPMWQDTPLAAPPVAAESPTADVFAASLVEAINKTLAENLALADLVRLEDLLEEAIEAVFLASNVSPEAAKAGVDQAETTLISTNVSCDLPEGPAVKRCEAVALAFVIARQAAEAAQSEEATGAIGSTNGPALGAPPPTGSGGGGGGVTHPPVAG